MWVILFFKLSQRHSESHRLLFEYQCLVLVIVRTFLLTVKVSTSAVVIRLALLSVRMAELSGLVATQINRLSIELVSDLAPLLDWLLLLCLLDWRLFDWGLVWLLWLGLWLLDWRLLLLFLFGCCHLIVMAADDFRHIGLSGLALIERSIAPVLQHLAGQPPYCQQSLAIGIIAVCEGIILRDVDVA